jgi:hypothetical protein
MWLRFVRGGIRTSSESLGPRSFRLLAPQTPGGLGMRGQPGRRHSRVALPEGRTPSDTEPSNYSRSYRRTTPSPMYLATPDQYSSNRLRRRLALEQRGFRREYVRPMRQVARSTLAFTIRNSYHLQRAASYEPRADVDTSASYQTGRTGPRAEPPAPSPQNQARRRRRTPYHVNPETDEDSVVGLFSHSQPLPVNHRAIFSQQLPCSLVHSSILDGLDSDPMNLPLRETRNILCPFGRVRTRQYVRLGIQHLGLQIEAQVEDFWVFDTPVPENGPYLYFGQPFLRENFQGRLPPSLPVSLSTPPHD